MFDIGGDGTVVQLLLGSGIVLIVSAIVGRVVFSQAGQFKLSAKRAVGLGLFGALLFGGGIFLYIYQDNDGEGDPPDPTPTVVTETATPKTETATPRTETATPLTETPTPTPCAFDAHRSPLETATQNEPIGATITAPRKCELGINPEEVKGVRGMYSGNMAGKDLWVLLYFSDSKRYYPQTRLGKCSPGPVELSNGRWFGNALLGLPDHVYDIVIAVVRQDSEAKRRIIAKFGVICGTDTWTGFEADELRGIGLTELDSITVKTGS